jgi:hypothetical protein
MIQRYLTVILAAIVFAFVFVGLMSAIRPAAAQVEAVIVSEHAQEFIPLPQPRPSDAPILSDTPAIYHEPGYFPQLDMTDFVCPTEFATGRV